MAMETKPESTTQLEDELVQSLLFSDPSNGVDVCFSFDTTGSMYSYINAVRDNITETLTALFADVPKIRISIMAHGDYCDGQKILSKIDFHDKSGKDKLVDFVRTVPMTGGGDYPEAYEYVLRMAQLLSWNKRTVKALVMIGDAPPQPPSYTDQQIFWRDEIQTLYRKLGVKIYAVQVSPNAHCMPFYREISRKTGGVYLELRNFQLIITMFKAICYREKSVQALLKFKESVGKKLGAEELFDKLEHETAPPPLGQYDNGWWDKRNDRGALQYVYNGKYYDRAGSKTYAPAHKIAPKPVPVPKPKPKTEEESMKEAIEKARSTAPVLSGTHTTRTGMRVLDTPNPVTKPKIELEKTYSLKEVKPMVWEIVPFDPQTPPSDKSKSTKDSLLQLTKEEFQANAVKRLMRDLGEVKRCPIHNISALPLEDNIMEWHCNMGGPASSPYADCIFHVILTFPHNYPRKPPSAMLCSKLFHDNVFGKWICLDMLELGGWQAAEETETIFTGWSYGYSVLSILLQLQAFLFEGVYKESHFVAESKARALEFTCSKCGHCKDKTHPPLNTAVPKKAIKLPEKEVSKPGKLDWEVSSLADDRKKTKMTKKEKKLAKKALATPETAPTTTPLPATPALPPTPSVPSSIKDLFIGQEISGKVLRVKEGLGAFVQLSPSLTGLLHISGMSGRFISTLEEISAICQEGQTLKVWVANVDEIRYRIGLTLIPLQQFFRSQGRISFDDLKEGDVRYGVVRGTQSYTGAFVDINVFAARSVPVVEGEDAPRAVMNEEEPAENNARKQYMKINGLLQNKDVGGVMHVWNVNDVVRVGEYMKVKVVKIDKERMRVWVSSKALDAKEVAAEAGPQNEQSALEKSSFRFLSVDMINQILRYLNPVTAQQLGYTCKLFNKVASDGMSYLWERNELVCFYSKRHFTEDVLGVGLNLENKLNGKLAYITTTFDLVSYEGFFKEKVRKAVYKEPFTHWLPLYINRAHGEKSLPLAMEAMAKICADCYGSFEPWMVLDVIPKLMNTMVVSVMSGKLWASVMALEGYCAFHHLLLMFLEIYPELKAKVDETIATFLRDDVSRHKKIIPALGEWLPLLTVTETYKWSDVAVPYLLEMFDRNVLWTLKQYPNLVEWPEKTWTDDGVAASRLRKTYDATNVSKHLLMFHVYFLDKVAKPPGVSLAKVREMLDSRYGKPTFAMKDQLMRECKRIRKVNEWPDFFEYIHVPAPSNRTLIDWLHQAQINSNKVGYHRNWQFQKVVDDERVEAKAAMEEKKSKKESAVKDRKAAMIDDYDDMWGR